MTGMLKKLEWDPLSKRRKAARLAAILKAYRGDKAWQEIGERLEINNYKSRNDHCHKIKRKKLGKRAKNMDSMVDRGIAEWNGLPQEAFENLKSCKLFRGRVLGLS